MALTTITNAMVSVNAIQGTLIADNAITAVHIATNAVSGTLVADNAITATHIAQNTITVTQIADDAIESAKIADGIITTNHLNKAMISSQTEVAVATGDFILLGDTSDSNNLKKAPISSILAGTLTTAAQTNITSLGTLTALTVDDITINGSTISDSGDLDFDVGGEIKLDSDGEIIRLYHAGTQVGAFHLNNDDLAIRAMAQDKDIIFKGYDASSNITALTLDMSDAGTATFNHDVVVGGNISLGDASGATITMNDTDGSEEDFAFVLGANALAMRKTSNSNDIMRLDLTNERVGIGAASPDCTLHINGSANSEQVIITGNGNASRGLSISTAANGGQQDAHVIFNAQDTGHADYPMMTFQTGGTERLRIKPTGDQILTGGTDLYVDLFADSGSSQGSASFRFKSDGASTDQQLASIVLQQESGGGSAQKGEMLFQVSDNANPTTAVKIFNNKNVQFATGITFGSDTASNHLLDDYDEGTWTPTYTVDGGGSAGTVTSTNVATYTKIGNLVHCRVRSFYVPTSGTVPTAYNMSLPFPAKNNGGLAGYGVGREIGQNGKSLFIEVDGNQTVGKIKCKDGSAPPANAYIDIAFTYEAA